MKSLMHQEPKNSTNAVTLSYWVFTSWWFIILGVHVLTCVYNGLYAFCYWKLNDTYLNLCFEFYKIGMQQPYYNIIAATHAVMSAIHGVCILLMSSGWVWQRSLAFTPWSTSKVRFMDRDVRTRAPSSVLYRLKICYNKVTYPCGLVGVRGKYFDVALIAREVVETALQTVQAYRMSALLPRALLNHFYVVLLVINCWSSLLVDMAFHKQDEARRRFACIALDCFLDLMACMGIQLIVLLAYVKDYDPGIKGFDGLIWYNDEWVARALNEFQIIVVVSWSDLVSRTVFSLSLFITTMSMKKLIWQQPQQSNRVSSTNPSAVLAEGGPETGRVTLGLLPLPHSQRIISVVRTRRNWFRDDRKLLLVAHIMFGLWGFVILGLHIHASIRPTLPQCLMQVRPWTASLPSCYLAGLDCHALGISGRIQEVEDKWSEFDASAVVQLLIRHCPVLEIPGIVSDFHRLRGIKVYNSTIIDWGESAAITNTNHPAMATLFIVRTNMTDGLLPAGFQSTDFPQNLNDIEICVTNLRGLPNDLNEKWKQGAVIQLEYSQLSSVPLVLKQLKPFYLFLTGNLITYVSPEIFEVEGMMGLGIGDMDISELPPNVTNIPQSLVLIEVDYTNISFFWSWADEFVGRAESPGAFVAVGSPYCEDFSNIKDGVTDSFGVPLAAGYSSILMNSSKANQRAISRAVDCAYYEAGPYYPLEFDDSINAISTPPAILKQR